MRLTELFEPQAPTKKKKGTDTVPEVFIIESLELTDEAKERREGAVLAAVLKMCGKNPLYYYIRTRSELDLMAREFENSGYRYLHISCHGGNTSLETTIDSITYQDFAMIFEGKLNRRRLFVSACSAGNELFAELVGAKNPEMFSVAAPAKDIRFDHAVAFWSAFYVRLFSSNSSSMNSDRITMAFKALANLFGVPTHWTKRNESSGWKHDVINR
ncbi:MAG: hypothetical protein ACR65R_00135 [Methylomicrobium sp.]